MPNFKTLFIILLFCQVSAFVIVPSKLKIPSAFFSEISFQSSKIACEKI